MSPPAEPVVNALWQLLQQHQSELGRYLDSRLAAHHEILFRRLAGESVSLAASSPIGPRLSAPQRSSSELLTQREDTAGTVSAGPKLVQPPTLSDTAQREDSASSPIGPRLAQGPRSSEIALREDSTSVSPVCIGPRLQPQNHPDPNQGIIMNQPAKPGLQVVRSTSEMSANGVGRLRSNKTHACSFETAERAKQDRSRTVYTPADRNSTLSLLSVHNCWQERRQECRAIIESRVFEVLVCLLIVTNVFFLGYEVQTLVNVAADEVPQSFRVVEYSYTACFTIELTMRIFANQLEAFFRAEDRYWNVLDLGLVLVSLMEVLMDILQDISPKLEYLRIVRMARTIRILRVVRIMKFFRPLRILAISVMNTVRSLAWTVVLLAMVIYLFGIVFTLAATHDTQRAEIADLEENFGTLWTTLVTLFKAITGGMDWEVCVNVLKEIHLFWPALFIGYIAFCQLALLNVVTGVVCQTAIESARQDQDIVIQTQLAAKQHYVEQFQELFAKFDTDRSGSITLEEFESLLKEPSWKEYFAAMDLTVDEAWNLFKLLDLSENCAIDVDEFVSGCLKLRGTARSLDVHMLMYQNKWTMKKMAQMMSSVDDLRVHLGGTRSSKANLANFSF